MSFDPNDEVPEGGQDSFAKRPSMAFHDACCSIGGQQFIQEGGLRRCPLAGAPSRPIPLISEATKPGAKWVTETPLGCSSYHKASAKAFTACLLMAYTPVEATETKELTEPTMARRPLVATRSSVVAGPFERPP